MERDRRLAWLEKPTRAERLGVVLVLGFVVLAVLAPLWTVVATSLATEAEIVQGGGLVLIPSRPSLDAYATILRGGVVTRAVLVSLGITLVGTPASVIATTALAYALSRPIVGQRVMLAMIVLTLFFVPGIIPTYLLVKQLGLLNSYASLIVPVLMSAFNLIVMRQFFLEIPSELLDSARVEGAGELAILFRIVLPLSKAVLAVVALFYAVSYWNAFFSALLYLNDTSMWPLQLVLRLYVLQRAPLAGAEGNLALDSPPPLQAIQMAVVVIAMLPVVIVYPLLQRFFIRGVLSGAIKG